MPPWFVPTPILPDAAAVPIPDVDDRANMSSSDTSDRDSGQDRQDEAWREQRQRRLDHPTYWEQWLEVAQYEYWEVTCFSCQTSYGVMTDLSLVWKHGSGDTFTESWPCRPWDVKLQNVDVYETWVVDNVLIERFGPRPWIRLTWRAWV